MKHMLTTVIAPAFLASLAYAAPHVKVQSTQVGKSHMEFDCPARNQLRLHVRSGEIRVVGSDGPTISVDFTGKNAGKIQDVKAQLSCTDSLAELRVSGGPKNELRITVHVPKSVDLFARIPAGEVTVENITGSKDVELHAGELTIYVGNPDEYGHVDASVMAGEVDAEMFGNDKGGLFRTISRDASGQYHLHAHVGSGQLTLR